MSINKSIDILDYVNGIGNGCMFAQSTPPLLVGTETSILTTPVHFSVDRPREIGELVKPGTKKWKWEMGNGGNGKREMKKMSIFLHNCIA